MGRVHSRLASACLLAVCPLSADSLRGRILADDGVPLPDTATVKLVCDDSVLATASLDSEGRFALEDASEHPGCFLEVTAPGYRRESLGTEQTPADHRIPAVVLHRLGKNQGETMSVSHLAAPEDAVRSFHAAVREIRKQPDGDLDSAIEHLRVAVRAYPGYAQAWFELGRLNLAQGDVPIAIEAFREAIRADPWFVSPYEPLILLLEAAGDSGGADRACLGLRRINPSLPPNCIRD